MNRILLKSKIHRGSVTEANLAYEGSLTLDPEFMRAADLVPYEKIHVVNINNGARFETYVIEGEPGDKTICLNGAAARLGQIGDQVIIMSYSNMDTQEALDHEPTIVLLDENNNIVSETVETVTV
jgi:aspartate 1-decarboxylase